MIPHQARDKKTQNEVGVFQSASRFDAPSSQSDFSIPVDTGRDAVRFQTED